MRVSTLQSFTKTLDNMQRAQQELLRTQEQIASGKRILSPADDPVASAQVLNLNQEQARTQQFLGNIDAAERHLVQEETTLQHIDNAAQRLRELTLQAGNGALSEQDRRTMATEARQLQDQLLGLMNGRNAQGEHLFAGSKGAVEPFVLNTQTERYEYQGDDGQRFIQVGSNQQMPFNDAGNFVFEAIDEPIAVTKLGADLALVSEETVADAEAFETFSREKGDIRIRFADDGAGNTTYSVIDSGGNPVYDNSQPPVALTDISYVADDTIQFGGLEMTVPTLNPDGSEIRLRAEEGKSNLLNVTQELITALETPQGDSAVKASFDTTLDEVLGKLDQAMERNLQTRTSIGARLRELDDAREMNQDYQLQTQEALSDLEDLDFAEAVGQLSMLDTVLKAAQASFVKVQGLSLFNYIR